MQVRKVVPLSSPLEAFALTELAARKNKADAEFNAAVGQLVPRLGQVPPDAQCGWSGSELVVTWDEPGAPIAPTEEKPAA